MKVQLKNSENEIIYTDFTSECHSCIESCTKLSNKRMCEIVGGIRRFGYRDESNGSVFCCSKSKDDIKSTKVFKRIQEIILIGVEEIEKRKLFLKLETNRLTHNLTKTNAHNIQELYAIVPHELLSENLDNQLETISKNISSNPERAARMFLRIAKNNAAIKTEFAVFNKVFGGISSVKKRKHNIRKVTLNLYHNFFQEFKDNNVHIVFDNNDDYIFIDYESMHAVLYLLFDNAAKYTLKGSRMRVSFTVKNDYYSIILDMISLKIYDDEMDLIHKEGFSGKSAIKIKREGQGIGLALVSRILEVNNAKLVVVNNVQPRLSTKINGVMYENNIFELQIRNYAQQSI